MYLVSLHSLSYVLVVVYIILCSFYIHGNDASILPAKSPYSSTPHTRWLTLFSHPLVWTCFHFYAFVFILGALEIQTSSLSSRVSWSYTLLDLGIDI